MSRHMKDMTDATAWGIVAFYLVVIVGCIVVLVGGVA